MLKRCDLRTLRALQCRSIVIHAADTGIDGTPRSAGPLTISVGLSRMYKDDHAQLDAAMPLYDTLYRCARDGVDETHASFEGQS